MPGTPLSSRSAGGLSRLASSELAADAASIDFLDISQGYSHLLLVARVRTDEAVLASQVTIRLNNDSGANYGGNLTQIVGGVPGGAAAGALTGFAAIFAPGSTAAADAFASLDALFAFYTGNRRKTMHLGSVDIPSSTAAEFRLSDYAGQWRNVAAVNRVTLLPGGGTNLVAGSAAILYGVS